MAHSKISHQMIDTPILGFNHIINGNFDIWQRAVSQTISGYGSDDRWYNQNVGSTKTHSLQNFTLGEVFPDGTPCPQYYSRTLVTSVSGIGNNTIKQNRIESVKTLAGKKVTLSFYAKANAAKNMTIEFSQQFGTGGSPSSPVYIPPQKIALTTVWKRFVITVDIPNIAGKILGTNNNHFLQLNFWFDAGSSFNSRTNTLGFQSGTFDLAMVSLIEGDKDIKPIPRSYTEEFFLCKAFYEEIVAHWVGDAVAATSYSIHVQLTTRKRTTPTISSTQGGAANGNMGLRSAGSITANGFSWTAAAAVTGAARGFRDTIYVDAEL